MCGIKTKKSQRIEGLKRIRIYPFLEKKLKIRINKRMKNQGKLANRIVALTNVNGVKGTSIVSVIPGLDISTCGGPEHMHSLLLGDVKQLIGAWFLNNDPWNLKSHITDIDKASLSIRPPKTFNRLPRSITLCNKYKASEFLNWLLYYSVPIMINYLQEDRFQHYILLVMATFILLQKDIHLHDINKADRLLRMFVRDIKIVYSDRMLTYNMHQLLHLCLYVK